MNRIDIEPNIFASSFCHKDTIEFVDKSMFSHLNFIDDELKLHIKGDLYNLSVIGYVRSYGYEMATLTGGTIKK